MHGSIGSLLICDAGLQCGVSPWTVLSSPEGKDFVKIEARTLLLTILTIATGMCENAPLYTKKEKQQLQGVL